VQAAELDAFGKGTQEEDRLKPRQLLLFNDMLMLVKDKSDEKLSYKAHIDFDDQVSDLIVAVWPLIGLCWLSSSTISLHGWHGVCCGWSGHADQFFGSQGQRLADN
jgi:hypothetical protein